MDKAQYTYRWTNAPHWDKNTRGVTSRWAVANRIRHRRADGLPVERIQGGFVIGLIAFERIGEAAQPPKRQSLRTERSQSYRRIGVIEPVAPPKQSPTIKQIDVIGNTIVELFLALTSWRHLD